jgi:uncharacterized protein
MNIVTRRSFVASLLALALLPWASAGAASREDELKERFKERFPQLASLKQSGAIGETYEGYVEIVDKKSADKDAEKLVDEENKDRKELYDLIAKKEGVTREKVAERNAKRNFEKAKPGEYLKGTDGKWKKKEAGATTR